LLPPGIFVSKEVAMSRAGTLLLPLLWLAAATCYAAAPKGSTGECKDGSYTSAKTERGACSRHGGVKQWYGNEAPQKEPQAKESKAKESNAKESRSAPAAEPSRSATRSEKAESSRGASANGGGRVWVNPSSKVYHCSGDRWYGKTEKGEYMSESQAKAQGNRPDHGKSCG
jgi:hypothetical protein